MGEFVEASGKTKPWLSVFKARFQGLQKSINREKVKVTFGDWVRTPFENSRLANFLCGLIGIYVYFIQLL
jgi:hypothetical protein